MRDCAHLLAEAAIHVERLLTLTSVGTFDEAPGDADIDDAARDFLRRYLAQASSASESAGALSAEGGVSRIAGSDAGFVWGRNRFDIQGPPPGADRRPAG